MEKYVKVGRIIKPHGIVGELKIKLFFPLKNADKLPPHFFITNSKETLPYFIFQLKELKHPDYILTLETITNRSLADKLAKTDIVIEEDKKDEFFKESESEDDLSGYKIYSESGDLIGQVEEILDLPAHKTFSVINEGKEILLPYVDDLVDSIDHNKKEIYYLLPDGLLDLY